MVRSVLRAATETLPSQSTNRNTIAVGRSAICPELCGVVDCE